MEQQVSYTEADSLNHLAYDMRYKDLSVAMKAAKRACHGLLCFYAHGF